MINAVGITAEYNPLHNGHIYHIRRARELSGCNAVAVAMSGSFVQRGEPAVFDKWTRAEHALRSGADLVIEIPVLYCLADAGQYGAAGTALLESLGCVTHIAFGSESGDTDSLIRTSEFLSANDEAIRDEIRKLTRSGLSYPAARTIAYEKIGGSSEGTEILGRPNDILAVEYIRSMKSAVPVAVRRAGAGYDEGISDRLQYQSAAGIRESLQRGGDVSGYVPECVRADIVNAARGDLHSYLSAEARSRLYDMVRYAVLSSDALAIDDCPSGGEGLGRLLMREVRTAESLGDLIGRVKSRRYTYTRLSRLMMQVLLGIARSGFYTSDNDGNYSAGSPGYIRILGFNDIGRELLSQVIREDAAALPVLTNINKERSMLGSNAAKMLELDIHAADIYNLISGSGIYSGSDHTRKPVIIPGHELAG